jgi:hypothetical protein
VSRRPRSSHQRTVERSPYYRWASRGASCRLPGRRRCSEVVGKPRTLGAALYVYTKAIQWCDAIKDCLYNKSRESALLLLRSILELGEQEQRLKRSDEEHIRLRDRTENNLDNAALDANLRVCSGIGAKSNCKVNSLAPCSIEIESHWVKAKVRYPVWNGTMGCNWVILVANRARFRASPMAGPALGDDKVLRTSVKFEEPLELPTVTTISCRAMSSLSLSRPRIRTSKSAGLSVLWETSPLVS